MSPKCQKRQQAVSVAAEHVSPYKILGGSPLGAVMQDSLLLQLPILLVVANGTAVVAKKLLAKMERVTKRTLT